MKAPFDIAGDLDTPVSAYMKLAAFRPCFLLESVEGGERLARYSFVGFGDSLEVKLDAAGLRVGATLHARPGNAGELLNQLRAALAAAPRPEPEISGVPLAGGLVGFASYDVVRFFEHLPKRVATADGVPALHYVAPAFAAGVRSSDAQYRVAACRLDSGAGLAAPGDHSGAAWWPADGTATGTFTSSRPPR